MLKLKMKNFGIYEKKDMTFEVGKFVLLTGDNGSGKSTCLKAISWALYGKDSCKKVTHGKDSCSVTLYIQNLKVSRVSKPKRLILAIDQKEYEGSVAQEMINSNIGMTWEQFCLSTMIEGSARCSLATVTPKERFDIVRELANSIDGPKQDAEKILQHEKSLKSLSDVFVGEINVLKSRIQRFSDIDEEEQWDEEEYNEKKSLLSTKKQQMSEWNDILQAGIHPEEAKEKLQMLDQKETLVKKLAQYKKFKQYAVHKQYIENLKAEYEKGVESYFKDVQKELTTLEETVDNVEEDEGTLRKKASECLTRREEKRDGNVFWDWTPEKINEEIDKQRLLSSVKPCPSCGCLLVVGETLQICKDVEKGEKRRKEREIKMLDALKHLVHSYDENALEVWETVGKNKGRLTLLRSIIENKTIPPHLISLKKSFGEKLSIPKGWKDSLTNIDETIEEIVTILAKIPDEDERETLEMIVKQQVPSKKKVQRLKTEIEELEERCEELLTYKERYIKMQEYHSLKKQLEETLAKQKQNIKDLSTVARLKELQKEAAAISLENVIDTLNGYAQEFLSRFFNSGITVQLSNIKQTQKSAEYNQVNITVQYKDTDYKITDFSQGELIKVNLSFILAMNKLLDSKLLCLDEVLQNLDKGILLEIYACLKSFSTENCSIFIVDHNSIEGFFDTIVQF